MEQTIRVLLIEPNVLDRDLIYIYLQKSKLDFNLIHCKNNTAAFKKINEVYFDIILTNLRQPSDIDLKAVSELCNLVPNTPVVVLTGQHDNGNVEGKIIKLGAQDFIHKWQLNEYILERVIRYAIERHKILFDMKELSLKDELTKLYNYRGFKTLANYHLSVAMRMKSKVIILFIDIDNLKYINDTFGHAIGNEAIIDTAKILKSTFRKSDIIGRIGGDEFVVMLAMVPNNYCAKEKINELNKNIEHFNSTQSKKYTLSVSTGHATFENNKTLDDLIREADGNMYTFKRAAS